MNEFQVFDSKNRTVVVTGESMSYLKNNAGKALNLKNSRDVRTQLNEKGVCTADTLTKGGIIVKNILGECMPETAEEKLMMLLGRIQALEAYVSTSEYGIDKEIVLRMLGLELSKKCKEEENGKLFVAKN